MTTHLLTQVDRQSIQAKLLIRRPITLTEALKLWDYIEVLEASADLRKPEPTTPKRQGP